MINKDFFKNIILSALVCSSVLLCLYIFIGDKLWPSGYNFFIGGNYGFIGRIMSVFGQQQGGFETVPPGAVIKPEMVVITKNDKRAVIGGKDAEFEKITDDLNKKVFPVLSAKDSETKMQEIDDEEWFNALKAKSIYLDYGISLPAQVWEAAAGVSNSGLSLPVKDIIIAPGDTVLGKMAFMFMDAETGKKYKIQTATDSEYMDEIIEKYMNNAQAGVYSFSFEINFDGRKKSGDQKIAQKVLFDSQVLLKFKDESVPGVKVTVPVDSDMQSKVEGILKLFGFRMGAIKRYVDTNGSALFVENYATLRISPNGMVEYQAIDQDKGFKLFELSNDKPQKRAVVDSVGGAAGLVQYIDRLCGSSGSALQLSKISVSDEKKDLVTLDFDYKINGLPLILNLSDAKNATSHAAEVTVQSGRVQKLVQYVRGVEHLKTSMPVAPVLKAINDFSKSQGPKSVEITDTFIAYIDNGSGKPDAAWCATLKGVDGVVPLR